MLDVYCDMLANLDLNIKTSKNDYTVFYFFKSLKICESMAI